MTAPTGNMQRKKTEQAYNAAKLAIITPWVEQVKKQRRGSRPHVNTELRRIRTRKKLLFDRMRWNPTRANKARYTEICAQAQRRERQLEREHRRRLKQRIQRNPTTHLAKALQLSAQRRARQKALDSTVGKLLKSRQFAEFLNNNMAGENGLTAKKFEVNTELHEKNVMTAIQLMDNNKAVGSESVHVEMLKTNIESSAKLLTALWCAVGRSTVVPKQWLEVITVPLFKGKGSQGDPSNYRPLTILSHLRKLTEKAVILEFDKVVPTDRAQFGFLAGVQVIQAALSVLAALHTTATFLAVLDLTKAYDSIVKQLLLTKLRRLVDTNLLNQLLVVVQ